MTEKKKRQSVRDLPKPTRCKCGTPLINFINGALCPKGCGGLQPQLSNLQNTANTRAYKLEKLPEAKPLKTISVRGVAKDGLVNGTVYLFQNQPCVRIPLKPEVAGSVLAHEKVDDGYSRCVRLRQFKEFTVEITPKKPAESNQAS